MSDYIWGQYKSPTVQPTGTRLNVIVDYPVKLTTGKIANLVSFPLSNGGDNYIYVPYRSESKPNKPSDIFNLFRLRTVISETSKIYNTVMVKDDYSDYYNPSALFRYNSTLKVGYAACNTGTVAGSNPMLIVGNYGNYTDKIIHIPTLPPFEDTIEWWTELSKYADGIIPWQTDNTKPGGGEGEWDDDTTDTIDSPSDTDLNTNTIGKTLFATTYKISFTALKGIAQKLWSTDFLDWVKQYFSNPLEGIINLTMIPVSYSSDSYYPVIIGNYNTNQVGNIIFDQYKTVDCGYIDIPEKWGGAIDYKSRITLYLPFIGSHDLDVIEIIGGRLSVSYIVDLVTGACVAFVKVKRGDLESVLYQFTGNCAYSMPVTQNSYNALLSSMLSASATVAVGVATGGASTPLMVGAGASVASDARPHVAHSGNLAGNTGYMGIKKPYIILTRPKQALPENFGKYIGYQSHITKRLSDCKGFTQVEYIHVDGIENATSEELQEIENYLKSGVIIA